jgi:hypothetical protein
MEQEFSWSGLVISLSIAFFIVLISAQGLNVAYKSLEEANIKGNLTNQNIYYLESSRHVSPDVGETAKRFFQTKVASAAEMSSQESLKYLYSQISSR